MKARLDSAQVARTGDLLRGMKDLSSFNYAGGNFPEEGEAGILDYFFAVVLQQYGFWYDDGKGYAGPMYAEAGGILLKGSDFLFKVFLEAVRRNPDFSSARFLARITRERFEQELAADSGQCPLPQLASHLELARDYGRELLGVEGGPAGMVERANCSRRPLQVFLEEVTRLPGYREDPLRKKALLLALILSRRPEGFLVVRDPENWAPVIDYHNLRVSLRLGLIEVVDRELLRRLEARKFVDVEEEEEIRRLTFAAVDELIRSSGRTVAQVDALLFGARRSCPETAAPDCPNCIFSPICPRRISLFQPVCRTTFY